MKEKMKDDDQVKIVFFISKNEMDAIKEKYLNTAIYNKCNQIAKDVLIKFTKS